jgi:hypothetical protein
LFISSFEQPFLNWGMAEMRMGLTGLEPVTLRLSSACSNQLSYRPGIAASPRNFRMSTAEFRFGTGRTQAGIFEKSQIGNLQLEIENEATRLVIDKYA